MALTRKPQPICMRSRSSYPYLRVTTRYANTASLAFICPSFLGRADGPLPTLRGLDVGWVRRSAEPAQRDPMVQWLRDEPDVRDEGRCHRPQRRDHDGLARRRPLHPMSPHRRAVLNI